MADKVRLNQGLRLLLSDDPCSFLLYSVEKVQDQAHHRRLGRVLRKLQRRKYELGWVHVSDAHNPCDRVVAARLLGYKLPRPPLDPRTARILENGTYTHLRFQNYFLSLPAPFEVKVAEVLKQWPLVGEADIIVYHPEFDWQTIELKTMNDNQFKRLQTPQESHGNQVNAYIGLLGKGEGQVWYENKNNQEIKTFQWFYDGAKYCAAKDRVEQIAHRVIDGELPDACGECEYDEYVGNLTQVEERMVLLQKVKEENA